MLGLQSKKTFGKAYRGLANTIGKGYYVAGDSLPQGEKYAQG